MNVLSIDPAPPGKRPQYIPALDGVRFLAVLFVILHHITAGDRSNFISHLLGLQRDNGIGPSLFFVLSGVLLTTVILAARHQENRYRNFILRRVARIFPLYFGYLALAVLATWAITRSLPEHMWVFAFFMQNNLLTAAGHTGSVLPLYHFWTLAVQDQFYLIWPVLLWRCDSIRRMRQLCYLLLILALLSRVVINHPLLTPDLFGRILPSRAGDMCLGALIAFESRQRTMLSPVLRRAFLPLVLLCVAWMWHGLEITGAVGSTLGLQLISFACGSLIVLALDAETLTARVLGSKYFALGGKKLAFAMYILHPLVLTVCIGLPFHSKMLRLSIFGAVTVLLSSLSYRFIESPILHLPIGRPRRTSEPLGLDPEMASVEDVRTAA